MGRFESIGPIQPFLKLQEGEWADVYKAYDTSQQKNVLLKRLKSDLASDDVIASRFENEARLMAQVEHPNVVSILGSGNSPSAVYFIAEFIEGKSLDQLLEAGPAPSRLAAYLVRETAAGLNAAHEVDIFHRDIKPANVLISTEGTVKLTDFGMASLTDTTVKERAEKEELRGTLGYMAPELFFEGSAGIPSDLFSLGAMLAELLAGQPPFRGESSTEILDQILNHDPLPMLAANPRIDAALLQICRRLLQKNPAHRFENCRSLIESLDSYLAQFNEFDGQKSVATFVADPVQYVEPALPVLKHETAIMPVATTLTETKRGAKRFSWPSYSFIALVAIVLFGITYFITTGKTPAASIELEPASAQANQISPPETTPIQPEPLPIDVEATSSQPPNLDVAVLQSSPVSEDDSTMVIASSTPTEQDSILRDVPSIGNLNVLCTPFCDVYLDGQLIGKAPPMLPMELEAGIHQIEMHNPDLPVYSTDVIVEAGQNDSLFIALRDFVGTIELNVFPWANVYIDSVSYGQIPPTQSFILTPGEHTLTLEHTELGSWTTTLLVAAGEKQPYTFNLKELLNQ